MDQDVEPYGDSDWRSSAANAMYDKKTQAQQLEKAEGTEQEIKRMNFYFDDCKAAILNNDWKVYRKAD